MTTFDSTGLHYSIAWEVGRFMRLTSTALVFLMTTGLSFFYGGLVRASLAAGSVSYYAGAIPGTPCWETWS